MTISVTITNNENPEDKTKELLVSDAKSNRNPGRQRFSLKGGASATLHVHSEERFELSERFMDRKK